MADHQRKRPLRCAIYTRKSSEEGLEQDFNSLHAQREACEAFIASQKHEGWRALPSAYDDGGFSGGSMDRPALQKLLADVAAGEIDVVVVYKVDRLTRSLTDFAKIVEVFDHRGVSFVSVTQAFNTTSSMGRLTLNVLLSFAQFEREVTSERIRDKIAASKKKGLWMGGFLPIGYEAAGRTLLIREDEAETIRTIYARYLELKSVDALKQKLERLGLKTRLRAGGSEQMAGDRPFSRGHLYRILSNPLYAGRIQHKEQTYEGQHPAIIDQLTFEAVQATLAANSHARLVKAHAKNPTLLSGLLFDENGNRLVASHTVKQGRRYRYYLSLGARKHGRKARPEETTATSADTGGPLWRLPAEEIEGTVIQILVETLTDDRWLEDNLDLANAPIDTRRATSAHARHLAEQLGSNDPIAKRGAILMLVERVVLEAAGISVLIRQAGIRSTPSVAGNPPPAETNERGAPSRITRALALRRRGVETRLVIDGEGEAEPVADPTLVKAVAQAHRWWRDLLDRRYATLREIAAAYDTDERYAAWIVGLAFLPPELTRGIVDGTQPAGLMLHGLLNAKDIPLQWNGQRPATRG